jgi:hypothetical protein
MGAEEGADFSKMNELDPRIRIRAPLRCDGIGRFDCAEDAVSGGRMAVRWLPLEANGDAAARACEKLPDHPTLPKIRQTGQMGGAAFVAMDFPNGHLLSTVEGERFDVEVVLRLGAQLADALATVHAQGVVHGELGAESILLVPPDRAYLWDMPLVIANRLSDRRGENRLMQTLVRIAPYLSPERARGEGASQAADVYSLGSILCVAAGAPLPVAASTLGVVHLVSTGAWEVQVPSTLPEGARAMLERMVAVDPHARPTAREAMEAFALPVSPAAIPTVREFPAVQLPVAAVTLAPLPEPVPALPAPVPARVSPPPLAVQPPALARMAPPAPAAPPPVLSTAAEVVESATDLTPVAVPSVPVAPPKAQPAVSLTENLSVHADLAEAGAHTVHGEMPLADEMRSHRRLWVAGSVMLGAVLALITVAVKLAAAPPVEAPVKVTLPAPVKRAPALIQPLAAVPAPAVAAPTVVAPALTAPAVVPSSPATVAASDSAEDELAPLTAIPKRPARASRAPMKASRIPGPSQAPVAPVAHEPEAAAPRSPEFNFLDDAPPPTGELKRPQL